MDKNRLQTTVLIFVAAVIVSMLVFYDFSGDKIIEYNIDGKVVYVEQDDVKKGMYDINTITKEELMSLDGIGEVLATRIIEYREGYGQFNFIEELDNVEGIGEGKLQTLMKSVYVK